MDDPAGYTPDLQSELRVKEAKIDSWLHAGAEEFASDPELQRAFTAIAEYQDSRRAILLLGEILRMPDLADRLGEVLRPKLADSQRLEFFSNCSNDEFDRYEYGVRYDVV